jgi:hypothetical protein
VAIDVKKLLEPINRATIAGFIAGRQGKLQAIKAAILEVRPNALETAELVDALGAGLRLRYDNPTEALLRMSLLEGDLERLDLGNEVDARDILAAYEQAVERNGGRQP